MCTQIMLEVQQLLPGLESHMQHAKQAHLATAATIEAEVVQLATLSATASAAASSTAYAVDTVVKEAMLWMSLQPRSTRRMDQVNIFKVLGQQVTAEAMAAAEACALTYEMVSDMSGSFPGDVDRTSAAALVASDVSNHATCTTAAAREIAQLCMDILEEAVDVRGSPLTRETACRCAEKALNSIEVATVAEQHKRNLDNALSNVMSSTMNQRPTSTFSQVCHIPNWKKDAQGEQWQQQRQQQKQQQSTEEGTPAWGAPSEIVAWKNGGPINQEEVPSRKVQAELGPLSKSADSTSQSFAQAAQELEVYLTTRAAHVFGERCTPSGACGNTEQCPVSKDGRSFAAACWRYGRTLAVGLGREEEVLSDADLASFVRCYDSVDTAMNGARLERLLMREHQLFSLIAVLKMPDALGSERKKECAAVDVQDAQRPFNGGNAAAHDWDSLCRRLGWAGPCNLTRSTACPWKWSQQQQQGMWRALESGYSAGSRPRSCDVQEALDGGASENFGGLNGDTWSIDTMTFASLHLMSVQSRSRQRRAIVVKQSSTGEADAPSTPHVIPTLNSGGSCSWRNGTLPRHDAKREDRDIREFLQTVLGPRLDSSGWQTAHADLASTVQRLREMNPATLTLSNSVRQNPERANTGPVFGAAAIMRGNLLWDQDAAAAHAAYPRPNDLP